MSELLNSIKTSLSGLRQKNDGICLFDVRPSRLIYVLAYALELLLFAVRPRFISLNVNVRDVLGVSGSTVFYVAHALASVIAMLLWSPKFRALIRVSVAAMLAGGIPMIFLPNGYARFAFAVLAYAGMGGAVTAARCGYAFAANNAERLLGAVIMFFSAAVIYFVDSRGADGVAVTHVLPLALLFALSFCLLNFKAGDFEVKQETTKADTRGLYWALALFIAYYAIDNFNWRFVDSAFRAEYVWLCAGMVIAGILLFAALAWLRLNTWYLWNLFFVFSIGMALFVVLTPQIGSLKPQYLFSGLTLMGWPLAVYMLGCAQRRFADYKLLKKCTVIFAVLSPLTTLLDNIVADYFPDALPVVTLVYVLAIAFSFIMLSPLSYKHLFSASWTSELHESDMTLLQRKVEAVDRFSGYGLTPRQREVAVLLLAAKTRRQISGELGLSESTVKMHAADLYRKLNINSRTELFRIFGVFETQEQQPRQISK